MYFTFLKAPGYDCSILIIRSAPPLGSLGEEAPGWHGFPPPLGSLGEEVPWLAWFPNTQRLSGGASWFTNSVLGGLTFTFQQGQETGNQTKERKTEEEEKREERPSSLPQIQQAAFLASSRGGIEIKEFCCCCC